MLKWQLGRNAGTVYPLFSGAKEWFSGKLSYLFSRASPNFIAKQPAVEFVFKYFSVILLAQLEESEPISVSPDGVIPHQFIYHSVAKHGPTVI